MIGHTSFNYRAAHPSGAIEMGLIDAASREAASSLLASRGLFPLQIQAETPGGRSRRRLAPAELALGLRMLAALLQSGLPISRALEVLDDLVPPSWKVSLPVIRGAVREGNGLASALHSSPLAVPPVVIGIIRAGEAGSGLSNAVRRAAELTERQAAARAALWNALTYPLILAAAGTASLGLLVGVVMPRFADILTDLGQAVPPTTQFVLYTADAIRAASAPALIVFVTLTLLLRAWSSTHAGRQRWHEILLAAPLLGSVRLSMASAESSAALAALLESGVPVAVALPHATQATNDAAVAARMLTAREAISSGQRIANALAAAGALTQTAVRLVRAGEESGRLVEMLAHAASIERERVEHQVRRAVRMIEPIMIFVFGGIVAIVAAALLQAVYTVRLAP